MRDLRLQFTELINAITGERIRLAWWQCATCLRRPNDCPCPEETTDAS